MEKQFTIRGNLMNKWHSSKGDYIRKSDSYGTDYVSHRKWRELKKKIFLGFILIVMMVVMFLVLGMVSGTAV